MVAHPGDGKPSGKFPVGRACARVGLRACAHACVCMRVHMRVCAHARAHGLCPRKTFRDPADGGLTTLTRVL